MGNPLIDEFKPPKSYKQELREHVMNCPDCVVDAGGVVWYCRWGAAIQQTIRKKRLFEGGYR